MGRVGTACKLVLHRGAYQRTVTFWPLMGDSGLWAGLCRVLRGCPMLAEQLAALGIPDDTRSMSIMTERSRRLLYRTIELTVKRSCHQYNEARGQSTFTTVPSLHIYCFSSISSGLILTPKPLISTSPSAGIRIYFLPSMIRVSTK